MASTGSGSPRCIICIIYICIICKAFCCMLSVCLWTFWAYLKPFEEICVKYGFFRICIKVHWTPKYFYANVKLCTYVKNISPLFAVFDIFTSFKTYEKLSNIICCTTESDGPWVYSWFDVTNCFACLQRLKEMQISLWCQIRNRPMPLTSSVI